MSKHFRKLDIDLPKQPTVNQRPWMVAGIVMALVILLFAGYAYIIHKNIKGARVDEKPACIK